MESDDAMATRLLPELGLFWLAIAAYLIRWLLTGTASTRWGWTLLIIFGPSLLLLLRAMVQGRRIEQRI